MIVDRKGDQEFAVSFDPDSQLLVEKGQVNLIKDGQGTPLADYHLLPGHRCTNCHSPKRTAPDVFGLQTGLLFQPQSCFDHGRDSVLQRQPLKSLPDSSAEVSQTSSLALPVSHSSGCTV